ncbi:MAG: PAS domain S-box protein [Xenococcaceae cyanobacterium]
MADKSFSQRLQKSILVYSALMILAIGVIIALVNLFPLYNHLKKDQQRNLLFALHTKILTIDEYLSRAKDIALQISSRTAIRRKLEAYNRREVSLDELVNFGQPILADALNKSQEVAGISRLDQTGKLVVQVGLPIPQEFWPIPTAITDAVIWPVPITLAGESYLVVGAPIINNQGIRVGTDIVLFKLEHLQQIVEDYTGLGETGETIVGTIHDGQVQLFFPLRGNQGHVSVHKSSPIGWAIEKAFHKDSGTLFPEKFPGVIAYAPIAESDWGLVVKMNPKELYAPVHHQIVVMGSVILILLLLGTRGMVFLLRPLTGKIIIHTDELERRVEGRTAALSIANALLREEVSAHQQTEEELRKSNEQLQREMAERQRAEAELDQIFNLSLDMLCIVGSDGYCKRPNPSFERILGYSNEELLARPFIDFVHPEDRAATMADLQKLSTGAPTIYFENRYRCKDGSYKWLAWTYVPVLPEGLLYAVARDITERKQAEKMLRESEERFRQLAENIQQVFWIAETDLSEILYISPAYEKIWGRTCESLYEQPSSFTDTIHPEDRDRVIVAIEEKQKKGREIDEEYRILRPDGSLRWIRDRAFPVQNEAGEVYRVVGIAEDITERKRTQQQLRQTQERLQYLVKASPAAIYSAKTTGDCSATFISENVSSQLGYEARKFLDNPKFWIEHIHPEDAPHVLAELARAVNQGHYTLEYRFRHRDGSYRWIQDEARLVRDAEGNPLEVVGYLADISDRKQAEEALRQSEVFLRTVVNNAPVILYAADKEGVQTLSEGKGLELIWLQPGELVGQSLFDTCRNFPNILENIRRVLAGAEGYWTAEFNDRVFDNWSTPLQDKNGQVIGLVGVSIDITERHKAEKSFQESQRLIQQIADTTPNLIYIQDIIQQRYIYINRQANEFFGRTPEEIQSIGAAFFEKAIHPDDFWKVANLTERFASAKDGEVLENEFRMKNANGEWRWIHTWDVVFTRTPEGVPEQIVGTAADISDRKQTEEALQQSEERFRRAVVDAPFPIMIHAEDGEILQINQVWTKLTGYTSDEIPTIADWTEQAYGERWEIVRGEIDQLYQLDGKIDEGEYTITTRSGESRIWKFNSAPLGQLPDGRRLVISMAMDITERKGAEEELKRKNAEMEAIFAAFPDLFFRMDDRGIILDYKAKIPSELYVPPEFFLGKPMQEVLPPSIGQQFGETIAQVLQTNSLVALEYSLPMPSGEEFYEARILPFQEDQTIAIIQNITKRKQAEEALHKSEARYSSLTNDVLDKSAVGIFILDADFRVVWINQALERFFDLRREDVVGQDKRQLICDRISQIFEDSESFAANVLATYDNNTYIENFECHVLPDDTRKERWLEHLSHPIHHGLYAGGRIEHYSDITERKQAEEALRQSEERFRQMAESIHEVFYLSDLRQPEMFYISPAYEEIWGRTCQSLYEQPHSFLDAVHPEDRQRVIHSLERQKQGESTREEYRIVKPDSSVHWVWDRTVPILDDSGQVYRVCGVVEDITDHKQGEERIRQLNEELEQRVRERTAQLEAINRELDSFSYSVSHDLRAPLRHINGFVNALRQRLESGGALNDPKAAHYLQVIEDGSQKMGQLIDGLLTLSRVGRRELITRTVDLRQLVETAINLVNPATETYQENNIEIEIGNLPIVRGDASLLQQVFNNLLGNAVKFSRDRRPARIEIGSLPDGAIFVKDNGVGFQMEYADQLFGAFQRLHSKKQFEGTGIGLSIVQRIIHRHGGEIWAESSPDRGATFYFKLEQMETEVDSGGSGANSDFVGRR